MNQKIKVFAFLILLLWLPRNISDAQSSVYPRAVHYIDPSSYPQPEVVITPVPSCETWVTVVDNNTGSISFFKKRG